MSATAPYLSAFVADPAEPAWLATRRRAALDRFADAGFPSPRLEAWRFTDLRPLTGTAFPPANGNLPVERAKQVLDQHRLPGTTTVVLLNGRLAADLSDAVSGVTLGTLAQHAGSLAEFPDTTAELATALFQGGLFLDVPAGAEITHPIHLVHLGIADAPQSIHSRMVVRIGEKAKATLIESFVGAETSQHWTNLAAEIAVGDGAVLRHARAAIDPVGAITLTNLAVTIGADARYESALLATGGKLARHDVTATLAGAHAYCGTDAVTLLRGTQDGTFATNIIHAAPGGVTQETVKTVLDDKSHGVFQGRIEVQPAGQKTDAAQQSRTLLLSENARIDTKPELEIHADDVKCAHGATVGDLDDDAMFYLVSRGIPKDEARGMLIAAFAEDGFARVAAGPARDYLAGQLAAWLGRTAS